MKTEHVEQKKVKDEDDEPIKNFLKKLAKPQLEKSDLVKKFCVWMTMNNKWKR